MPKERHSIEVNHNIEVAHRLTMTPGKCENIHGHSMQVYLEMWGELDKAGILAGVEFGDLKARFRHHLDTDYDHHTLLHHLDPKLMEMERAGIEFPGAQKCRDDPTTEHIAMWIGGWGLDFTKDLVMVIKRVYVRVTETQSNAATWEWEA